MPYQERTFRGASTNEKFVGISVLNFDENPQLVGAVEYTDCVSAEEWDLHP